MAGPVSDKFFMWLQCIHCPHPTPTTPPGPRSRRPRLLVVLVGKGDQSSRLCLVASAQGGRDHSANAAEGDHGEVEAPLETRVHLHRTSGHYVAAAALRGQRHHCRREVWAPFCSWHFWLTPADPRARAFFITLFFPLNSLSGFYAASGSQSGFTLTP